MDGQSRTSDEAVERPLQVRYDQKIAKYGQVADQNNDLRLIPAVFSHTGQIHEAFKTFVKEQIRAKLEHFEGPVKNSKVRSHLKWWVKCNSLRQQNPPHNLFVIHLMHNKLILTHHN